MKLVETKTHKSLEVANHIVGVLYYMSAALLGALVLNNYNPLLGYLYLAIALAIWL